LGYGELNSNRIIEIGKNSKGCYRKYADGTLEMWGNIVKTVTTVSLGNAYSAAGTISLPVESLTYVTGITFECRHNGSFWMSGTTGGDNRTNIGYRVYALNAYTAFKLSMDFRCFGTWK